VCIPLVRSKRKCYFKEPLGVVLSGVISSVPHEAICKEATCSRDLVWVLSLLLACLTPWLQDFFLRQGKKWSRQKIILGNI
jgi:hypothetical protein